jgi:DNA mismatch endonuclease (patch repair protein)
MGNRARDRRVHEAIAAIGWRVGVVWECSWKGTFRLSESERLHSCSNWLKSSEPWMELTEYNDSTTRPSE